jgi:hypothetical protein
MFVEAGKSKSKGLAFVRELLHASSYRREAERV